MSIGSCCRSCTIRVRNHNNFCSYNTGCAAAGNFINAANHKTDYNKGKKGFKANKKCEKGIRKLG